MLGWVIVSPNCALQIASGLLLVHFEFGKAAKPRAPMQHVFTWARLKAGN